MATVSATGNVTYVTGSLDSNYIGIRSECPDDCAVCEGVDAYFSDFSYIDGDVYIVGKW